MMQDKDHSLTLIEEDYPEIGKRLSLLWCSEEFTPYISRLLDASPRGYAKIFSAEALVALEKLSDLHKKLSKG
jgi:hypothetical protein